MFKIKFMHFYSNIKYTKTPKHLFERLGPEQDYYTNTFILKSEMGESA